MNSPAKFVRGLTVPFKGFYLIMTSFKLMLLAAIPVWICLAFICYIVFWFMSNPLAVAPYVLKWVPGLQSFIDQLKIGEFSLFNAIFQGLFWVFLVLFASYFSYILLSIIGAPFYSVMANTILNRKGVQAPKHNFLTWLYTTLKMLTISLIKLAFFVGMGGVLFIFSFIPAGMLFVPIAMCLLIAFDCVDFSFESMTFSIKQRWSFFYDHFPAFVGLAMVVLFVGSIPGFFTLFLPLFIAGGADLFADLYKTNALSTDAKGTES